jgi:hypothetical protein
MNRYLPYIALVCITLGFAFPAGLSAGEGDDRLR